MFLSTTSAIPAGRHMGRGDGAGNHSHLRRVPALRRREGLVHGARAPPWFLRPGPDRGGTLHDRRRAGSPTSSAFGAAMGIYFHPEDLPAQTGCNHPPSAGAVVTTRAGRRKKRPATSSFPKYALRRWPRNDRHGIRAGHETLSQSPPNRVRPRTPTRFLRPARAPPGPARSFWTDPTTARRHDP